MIDLDDLTGIIVDTGLRIHRTLGPGLFESVYEAVLAHALRKQGLLVLRQQPISFGLEGLVFEEVFRADLLVDGRVIVQVKSNEKIGPVHPRQLLTYLRVTDLRVGLLMNFGAPTFKEGWRVVNDLRGSVSPRLRVKPPARDLELRSD